MKQKSATPPTGFQLETANNILYCQGRWDTEHYPKISQQIQKLTLSANIILDGKQLTYLDSAGALLIAKLINKYHITLQNFSQEHATLLDLICRQISKISDIPSPTQHNFLYTLGIKACNSIQSSKPFLTFIGEIFLALLQTIRFPHLIRWRETTASIESGGYTALPIIGLLSFLIGVVLAYQMGIQLQTYGANIFIVNFIGLAVLREFGPLLTAIIIAGRTGSAFTAQLGMMKINEEIDALRTMGIAPVQLLILPRLFALIITLPLLSVWSDIFGVLGGMLMAKGMLGINFYDFLKRFQDVIQLKTYIIGLIKTPVFALLIAMIGCYQGLQVSGSAESVGRLTTKSVVQAIFFIIVADAGFSILFSWLGI